MDTIDKTPRARLIKKGAEASLFQADWHNRKAIIKVRIPKRYRPPELEKQIRSYRTAHEPQLMHEAKAAGAATPLNYLVNIPEATIIMQYIEEQQMKGLLNKAQKHERQELCSQIGQSVAHLHKAGIIHGDLTTSNMIRADDGTLYFVDFGLGEKNSE